MNIKGGDVLEQRLKEISANLKSGGTLRVGFLEGAKYPDGKSVALIGAIQNFGAPRAGIPPRPFFTNAVVKNSPAWPDQIALLLRANNFNLKGVLELMGQQIKEEIQEEIRETYSPALSPITIMLRGMRANDPSLVVTGKTVGIAAQRVRDGKTNYGASTKPLIDSGYMLSRVDFEVSTK